MYRLYHALLLYPYRRFRVVPFIPCTVYNLHYRVHTLHTIYQVYRVPHISNVHTASQRFGFMQFKYCLQYFTDAPNPKYLRKEKIKSISERKSLRYLVYWQYLGFVYCGIIRVPAIFGGSVLQILPYSQFLGFKTVGCWCTWVLHCGYCQVLAVFRPMVLRARAVTNCSQHALYLYCTRTIEVYSTICAGKYIPILL